MAAQIPCWLLVLQLAPQDVNGMVSSHAGICCQSAVVVSTTVVTAINFQHPGAT
jgi:hypothetical protein